MADSQGGHCLAGCCTRMWICRLWLLPQGLSSLFWHATLAEFESSDRHRREAGAHATSQLKAMRKARLSHGIRWTEQPDRKTENESSEKASERAMTSLLPLSENIIAHMSNLCRAPMSTCLPSPPFASAGQIHPLPWTDTARIAFNRWNINNIRIHHGYAAQPNSSPSVSYSYFRGNTCGTHWFKRISGYCTQSIKLFNCE